MSYIKLHRPDPRQICCNEMKESVCKFLDLILLRPKPGFIKDQTQLRKTWRWQVFGREIAPEVYWNPAPATMGCNKLLGQARIDEEYDTGN
jgi:hypothetical protein